MNLTKHVIFTIAVAVWMVHAGTPTDAQFLAFSNLANGVTKWPIWQIEREKVEINGKLDEEAWNSAQKIYTTSEWMWTSRSHLTTGLKDVLARWRVMYDTEYVYLACEFYDDIHTVDADGVEPWWNNDGVDVMIVPQSSVLPLDKDGGVIEPVVPSFLRFFRRFCEPKGLFGIVNGTWIPRDPRTNGWSGPESEGSSKLGGVLTCAAPIEDSCTGVKYPGAWCMEIRIPIAGLLTSAGMGSAGGVFGKSFKMNLAFTDDDVTARNDQYGVVSSTHRHQIWWRDTMTTEEARFVFAPSFIFAGFRENGQAPRFTPPDEMNLYCWSYNVNIYEAHLSAITSCQNSGVGVDGPLPAFRGFSVTASPNPFNGSGLVSFTLPFASDAQVRLFGVQGGLVRDFGRGFRGAGVHALRWDGLNGSGSKVGPGNYIIRLDAAGQARNFKLAVVK